MSSSLPHPVHLAFTLLVGIGFIGCNRSSNEKENRALPTLGGETLLTGSDEDSREMATSDSANRQTFGGQGVAGRVLRSDGDIPKLVASRDMNDVIFRREDLHRKISQNVVVEGEVRQIDMSIGAIGLESSTNDDEVSIATSWPLWFRTISVDATRMLWVRIGGNVGTTGDGKLLLTETKILAWGVVGVDDMKELRSGHPSE